MIDKKIMVDGKEIAFRTSAALPRIYRDKFKSDVFIDLNKIRSQVLKNKKSKKADAGDLPPESMSTIENLAYCMAKHADKTITDDVDEWLAQFSTTAIYKVAQQIMVMWNEEQQTTSTAKNQQGR